MNEPTGSAATSKSATSHRHHYHWDWHYGTGAPVNSPSYYPPPVVVQQAPVVYMQLAPQAVPAQPAYWYYCQDPPGYYPYVNQCPRGWMKVVPAPPGPY